MSMYFLCEGPNGPTPRGSPKRILSLDGHRAKEELDPFWVGSFPPGAARSAPAWGADRLTWGGGNTPVRFLPPPLGTTRSRAIIAPWRRYGWSRLPSSAGTSVRWWPSASCL